MKSQGLPITTVVLAALAIIVLVVLVAIVVQRGQLFGKGLKEVSEQNCIGSGGEYADFGASCEMLVGNFPDLPPGKICCKQGTVS